MCDMFQIQFTAVTLMLLLTLTLVALRHHRTTHNKVVNRSRWLMAGGTAMLAVQFLLQLVFHFRDMGVTQAVMVNLLFFIPCSWLFSLSVLCLQRQGNIRRREWWAGILTWLIVAALLAGACLYSGKPLLTKCVEMTMAEMLASVLYAVMQLYYTYIQMNELRRMHRTLDAFYDLSQDNLLGWMERSIVVLGLMALAVPLLIFNTGLPLAIYALSFFVGIYYLVISFVCYVVSNAEQQMLEAERNETEDELTNRKVQANMPADGLDHIAKAIENWVSGGGHLHSGITIQTAATEMGIPRYLLSAWLKTTPQELFSPWLTELRIEEAKRQMAAHPEWSNDSIAQACGFASRTYFQNVFHKQTGMTPTEFLKKEKLGRQ